MPEYLSPGVYVEEIEIGAKPIEGVSTSTAGFLGEAERGPTIPRLVTSWLDYQRVFGSYFGTDKYLPYAVEGFFMNGGKRCYIGRIVKAGDVAASTASLKLTAGGANALTVGAVGEGAWGNRIAVKVTKGTLSGFRLSVFYWKELPTTPYDPETNPKATPRPSVTEVFDNISVTETSPDYYEKRINGISNLIRISRKTAEGDTGAAPDPTRHEGTAQGGAAGPPPTITLANTASGVNDAYNGMRIEITGGTGSGQVRTITDYDGATFVATVDSPWTTVPDNTSTYRIIPTLVLADYQRADTDQPGNRKGLTGFAGIDEISIVYSPNSMAALPNEALADALITHCETLKDRFAIIDAAQGSKDVSVLDPRGNNDTKYAAFYYPWIYVIDPEAGLLRLIPPGGHVAGIYARSDIERGVHKAPANEVVRGAADLEFQITKGEQDILNPRGVNVIRAFPGRGIRVWGARTLSSDTLWKYINVRRLFLYVEESIEEGTQWVVFEPNNEKLWARVRATITEFLTRVWRDGALMGTKPEEAFFVKCDRTTMTQDDIDNGRLICIIGIAPVKPAEFVIFRIAQFPGGSSITE
ncbi:MAG TPA: phage tail sheath family protein [Thermodesulfobacteriota bacterium]|nr:phage tail sheath family protein [Thermodesulfobacteriota bacterium]